MKIIIVAESEEDREKLKAEEVTYCHVHSCAMTVLSLPVMEVPQEFSRSFGDGSWIMGRLYVLLKTIERGMYADPARV